MISTEISEAATVSGMRKIGFRTLWMFWAGGLIYSFGATALGIFPQRTLAMRLLDDFDIAFFLLGAWLLQLVLDADGKRGVGRTK